MSIIKPSTSFLWILLAGSLAVNPLQAADLSLSIGTHIGGDEHSRHHRHHRHHGQHDSYRYNHPGSPITHSSDWYRGHWEHGRHHGHNGWWWVVGRNWHLFPRVVYPYPDPYLRPEVVVVRQTPSPQVVYVSQPTASMPSPFGVPSIPSLPPPSALPPISSLPPSPPQEVQNLAQQTPSGQICRDIQTTIEIDGLKYPGKGRACQQPDGSWHLAH
ncbi:MAG: hypothetical protein HQL64_15370 [Magnetococcales bacterium]|nr:hypothetical protein [Magnetococcales bacterium]